MRNELRMAIKHAESGEATEYEQYKLANAVRELRDALLTATWVGEDCLSSRMVAANEAILAKYREDEKGPNSVVPNGQSVKREDYG